MAPVPKGGYQDIPNQEAAYLVGKFNETYSLLLDHLQGAWESAEGQARFWHAIEVMFELEKYAKPLMQIPRDDCDGNYGPDFRYIPLEERSK